MKHSLSLRLCALLFLLSVLWVALGAPLLAAETVSAAFEGPSYAAAQQFAAMLCPAPRLPSLPGNDKFASRARRL